MVPKIRVAEPADIPGIRGVARAAWSEAHAPIVGDATVESFLAEYYDAQSFVDRIERDDVILDVATRGDDPIVGYVLVIEDEDDPQLFHLAHIYVDPNHWGDGIGQSLLDHVETRVQAAGGHRIRLGVMTENRRAVDFYDQAGYHRVEEGYDERLETPNATYEKQVR